ncbi:MAG: response regulator [Allorhizobium sp.]
MTEFAPDAAERKPKGSQRTNGPTLRDADIHPAVLDAMCEALSAAIIVYDKNDQIVYASGQVCTFFPVPRNFLQPGTRLRDFLGAMYDHGGRQSPPAAGNTGSASRDEWIAERIAAHWRERSETQQRDARDRWIKLIKRRLPSGFGICIVTDITETKKRDEQWQADVERVQLTEEILDNLPHPIFVEDRNLTLVAVNRAFCELVGVGADALLGRSTADAFDGEFSDHLREAGRHVLETGAAAVASRLLRCKDGAQLPVAIRTRRVGKPGRYFVVTALAEGFSDPGRSVSAATPSPGDHANVAGAGIARNSVEGKGTDHAGADAPLTQSPAPKPRPMMAGAKVLLVTADREFEATGLRILSKLGVDVCSVQSEAELEAFLGIAASVAVTINLVVVDVQMEVTCLERARHYRVDYLALDGYELATELAFQVERVLSGESAGAAPVNDDWEISTGLEPEPQQGPGRTQVLVAEDNEINQIVFAQILEGLGYSYRIAATGAETVRLFQELRPQIVLMDITLPDMNGLDACRAIRELEKDSSLQTPVIGVLVQAFDRDRHECSLAGMDDVIIKPVSPDIIEATFQRFLQPSTEQSVR